MAGNNLQEVKKHLIKNLGILLISILIAVFLVRAGFVGQILQSVQAVPLISALVVGFFIAFALTVAPAIVTLVAIAEHFPVWQVALVGSLGSVLANLLLFRFVKERITDDIITLFERSRYKRVSEFLKLSIVRAVLPIVGAVLVASPLPDEIGLAMMGVSKIKTKFFVITMYILHFLGILFIISAGKALL